MGFLPEVGGALTTLLAFVVALSVIVAIHEYGHYIIGRISGIRAHVFSIGFGPVLLSRVDKHGTKWQIAALPFGGYVKFWGDANAASGKDAAAMSAYAEEDLRHTMHGAPLWARAATVAAGPFFNFALSIVVFAAVLMFEGRATQEYRVGRIWDLPQSGITLREGDEILAINGVALPEDRAHVLGFYEALPQNPELPYTVERDGARMEVVGPYPRPPLVMQLQPASAAYEAGLKVGDVITHIDGAPIAAFDQLKAAVEGSDGRALALKVWRAGDMLDLELAAKRVDEPLPEGGFRTQWRIGILGGTPVEPATERLGLGDAITGAVATVWNVISGSISGLYHMISGAISSCNLSGPVGIAKASGAMASQGTQSFVYFIAVMSTAIGMLNLFPIPMLDGGHLVFYAYEAVTGKPPADWALNILMHLGLAIVLGLMAFGLLNDLVRCP